MKNDLFHDNFNTLDEFADVVSGLLQCPITIEDANHRLLAYSMHDEVTDSARVSTIIGRRVPEKVINRLWKDGVIPSLLESKEPIRIKSIGDIGLGDRVAISIWKKDEILGFIWALEVDKKLDEESLLLLKKAADVAKNKLLQMQVHKNKKEERSQELFWKLLTGHFRSSDEIEDHFYRLQMTPAHSIVVAVFQFQDNITSEEEKQILYLINTNQRLKLLLYTVDHHHLILLMAVDHIKQPLTELTEFVKAVLQKMHDRFNVNNITPAFSSIYTNYQQIEKAYNEALSVLSIKEKFPVDVEHIYGYQNLGIYQFLDVLLEKRTKDGFKNQALEKLKAYDRKHHSELVETLDVYLNKDYNVYETASTLNIHTNTLNYRLKRISEIGEINLKDPNQKFTLYLDIKLERYK